jgi:hypothetical protein
MSVSVTLPDPGHYLLLVDPIPLLLLALAAARLTHLVTTDTILDRPRLAASRWEWSETLLTCPWCIGWWISLLVVAAVPPLWPHPVTRILITALAISYLVGKLESTT